MHDNFYTEKLASAGKLAEGEVRFGGPLVGGLSVEEAARFLGIGRSLVFEEIKAGRLVARKGGRKTLLAFDGGVAYLPPVPIVGAAGAWRSPSLTKSGPRLMPIAPP